jgi:hypothetical protein
MYFKKGRRMNLLNLLPSKRGLWKSAGGAFVLAVFGFVFQIQAVFGVGIFLMLAFAAWAILKQLSDLGLSNQRSPMIRSVYADDRRDPQTPNPASSGLPTSFD